MQASRNLVYLMVRDIDKKRYGVYNYIDISYQIIEAIAAHKVKRYDNIYKMKRGYIYGTYTNRKNY